jgi:hypothetical protein
MFFANQAAKSAGSLPLKTSLLPDELNEVLLRRLPWMFA